MTAVGQNLEIYRGDDALVFIELTDAAGDPFDPATASAIRYRIAATPHAAVSLVYKDLISGIALVEGGINVAIDAGDTAPLLPNFYYHELKILGSPLGDVVTALTGTLVIRKALAAAEQMPVQLSLVGSGGSAVDGTIA